MLVISGLTVGGAEYVVCNLADWLAQKGHHVHLVVLSGPIEVRPSDDRVNLHLLSMTKSLRGALGAVATLRRLIKQFDVQIVNSHLFHANILARLACVGFPIAQISSSHNTIEGSKFRDLLYKVTDRFCSVLTNVSNEACEKMLRRGLTSASKVRTLTNGIDIARYTRNEDFDLSDIREEFQLPPNSKILLSVGRLHPQKNYPSLFRALSILAAKNFEFRLIVVGGGPSRNELRVLARDLGIEHLICFAGLRSDVPSLMNACDVFVSSSAWEGFGLVVAEAMACERVVVATDCGGVAEVVGNCGYIVAPCDDAQLSNAIASALQLDKSEAAKMGFEARERICSLYTFEASAQRWIALYREFSYETHKKKTR